jgi:TATA-box binding protein (TBP) (component of TFIID and TFIIIB)
MGCRSPLTSLPLTAAATGANLSIKVDRIQSVTVTANVGRTINLIRLANSGHPATQFDGEIFPAVRLTHYNPLCVNVFSSGKITILGLKNLNYQLKVDEILLNIKQLMTSDKYVVFS